MKHLFIVANWKSNKTVKEVEDWINELKDANLDVVNKEIIICPSFTLLSHTKSLITNYQLSITLGAQNISPFDEGEYLLTPIFCIQNEDTFIPEGVKIVAYEPVEAIGTGNPDTPENAEKVARVIKNTHKDVMYVLYGGSVTSANISGFTKMPSIDGALVGGASLDAKEFTKIIQNA
ncbi:MAG: triosephosphate isomerase [Candidatus Levybacteria bacterium]|nr:triosephosphate isomerase [Candidatus Levybacteria bacterium]